MSYSVYQIRNVRLESLVYRRVVLVHQIIANLLIVCLLGDNSLKALVKKEVYLMFEVKKVSVGKQGTHNSQPCPPHAGNCPPAASCGPAKP